MHERCSVSSILLAGRRPIAVGRCGRGQVSPARLSRSPKTACCDVCTPWVAYLVTRCSKGSRTWRRRTQLLLQPSVCSLRHAAEARRGLPGTHSKEPFVEALPPGELPVCAKSSVRAAHAAVAASRASAQAVTHVSRAAAARRPPWSTPKILLGRWRPWVPHTARAARPQ
jgi:hypothetical protein